MNIQCNCGLTGGCALCNPIIRTQDALKYITYPHVPAMVNQGWECPRCKRVYGPTVTECFSCNAPINHGLYYGKEPVK